MEANHAYRYCNGAVEQQQVGEEQYPLSDDVEHIGLRSINASLPLSTVKRETGFS